MKINSFQAFISVALCALIAFGFYRFPDNTNHEILGLGSFITLVVTLVLTIAVSFNNKSKGMAFKTTAGIFFSTLLISNFVFSFYDFDPAVYLVVAGVQFLTFLSIAYAIANRKEPEIKDDDEY